MSRRPPTYDDLPLFAGTESTAAEADDEVPGRRGDGRGRSRRPPRDLAESLPLFPEAATEPEPPPRVGSSAPNLIYDGPMDDGDGEVAGDDWGEDAGEPPFDVESEGAAGDGCDREDSFDEGAYDDEAYEADLEAEGPQAVSALGHELPDVEDLLDDQLEDPYAVPLDEAAAGSAGALGGQDEFDDYGVEELDAEGYATGGRPARVSSRLLGGLADLAVHAAVLGILLIGNYLLGVSPDLQHQWPPLLLFLLVFSFFYTVVPLAFWGQTPGMASLGLSARSLGGENLSFVQTTVRWLVALVTLALAGLPLLLALRGRSLGDRLSGSHTLEP